MKQIADKQKQIAVGLSKIPVYALCLLCLGILNLSQTTLSHTQLELKGSLGQ